MTTSIQAAPDFVPKRSFDRAHWLLHCEGFRVDTANSRLGFVEEIRRSGDGPDDPVLAPNRIIGTEPAVGDQ